MRLAEWRKVFPVFNSRLIRCWSGTAVGIGPHGNIGLRTGRHLHQKTTGFYPTWIDGIESLPEQIAAGLNFPAVAAAALSIVPFENQLRTGASRELAMHIAGLLLVCNSRITSGRCFGPLELRRGSAIYDVESVFTLDLDRFGCDWVAACHSLAKAS
jgi:hypothetical protein